MRADQDLFEGVDYYGVEDLLQPEEREVRDAVREFVSRRCMPLIVEHFRAGTFPEELIPEFGKMGLLGANLRGYGCAGVNNVSYGLMLQEVERCDSGLRSFISVQGALVMYPIWEYGTQEQKERWLPLLAKGEAVGCFGLTEPDYGSNPGGLQTRAVETSSGWRLQGSKMWITNGHIADVAVIWARTEDGVIRGFLVETEREGFEAREIEGKFSMRASITSQIFLDDVEIPRENLLPKAEGLKAALRCLNQARYGIAWGVIGSMMACYREALDYARNRVQFGKPIASFQLVQRKLVYMLTEITKAQLLALQLGRLKDRGELRHTQVSLAKRNNVYHALRIARLARDILGGNGIVDEHHVIRHMCNLETVYTYEGTHDIHTLIVGEDITGFSAFQ
ncbi:MAG: acyl-CoA dehydrogenase [Planctomycetota bacterium]|nr:MAG: acyl-CoA dehydrogenase [Planctomycetota bacterium]